MRKSRRQAIANLYAANPFAIASWLVVERLWIRFKSALMAFFLNAPGLYLGPGCRVIGARHIVFGRGVRAQRDLWIEAVADYASQRFSPRIEIGDHVSFSDSVHLSAIERIAIGNHVLMGSRIYISDHNHGIYKGEDQCTPSEPPAFRKLGGGGPVVIGKNVWIGDNSVIVGPAQIGDGAIIGANSVVRGRIESGSMVAGAPAKLVKKFNPATGCWERA